MNMFNNFKIDLRGCSSQERLQAIQALQEFGYTEFPGSEKEYTVGKYCYTGNAGYYGGRNRFNRNTLKMKTVKVNSVDELQVGDTIKILKRPKTWCSNLHDENPLRLEFPRTLKIKDITLGKDGWGKYSYHTMTCGEYGWCLDDIVDAGCLLVVEGCEKVDEDLIQIL